MSVPTPTPALTPEPVPTPGCGNGIVDDGEFCDGESFCSNCSVALSACCQLASPVDGEPICVDIGIAGAQACTQVANGNFLVGTTCAGEPCDDIFGGCHRSPCQDETFAPVSACCQRTADRCTAQMLDSASALATFIAFDCNNTGEEKAVIGACGDDGRCVPRR